MIRFKKKSVIVILISLSCTLCVTVAESQVSVNNQKPNILLIQTDDMGYDDLGFHGRKDLETPNLDKLASESVRFTDFTVSSVCAPSRAMLLTGRHFLKTGVAGVHGGHDFINLDETLMPELFKQAGYVTGMFGKWHSGKTDGYFPWDRGFDKAYIAKLYQYFPSEGMFNDKAVTENRWATEVITDYAIHFIKENKDKPFFAYVPYFDPHGLWKAPKEKIKKYQEKGLAIGYATLCGMLDFLDENIGRLLAELEKQGLAKNTLVIFMSDNGPQPSDKKYGRLNDEEWTQRNPSGFPGWKGTNWNNGVKSPLFFRWTSHYIPSSVLRLVDITDILPTLLDVAEIRNYKTNKPIDGRSIQSYLKGNTDLLPEKKVYLSKWFAQIGDSKGESFLPISDDIKEHIQFEEQSLVVRDEHFALLMNANPQPRPQLRSKYLLFNLKEDPLETTNLATKYPDKVKSMVQDLETWYKDIVHNQKSYQAPQFQIGWKDKKIVSIPAYGPCRIYGNLINDAHYLSNWTTEGDKADYQFKVLKPGKYRIEISMGDAAPQGMEMQFSFKGKSIKKELSNNPHQAIGNLFLDEGEGIFSMEIIKNKNAASIKQLLKINLIRL